MKFKGKIIISDIDGTYTGSEEGVRRNNEAIEYFKAEGGLFTFATGRVEFSVTSVVPDFFSLCNAPAVMSNGSYLYEQRTDTRINEICIDTSFALPFLSQLQRDLPETGIRINRGKGYMTTMSINSLIVSTVIIIHLFMRGGRHGTCHPGCHQDRKSSSSSSSRSAKSSSARLCPPSGVPSDSFCKLFKPQAMPLFPFELKA